MDDPSVRTIVDPCKAGEEAAVEKVEPSHAVAAWVPPGTVMEILCGENHHIGWECSALLPCCDLAKPEAEGVEDVQHRHRVGGRMALRHSSRGSTTDLDLRAKIGDEKSDKRNRHLECRLLKSGGLEIGTHNDLSRRTRDVEVHAWFRVVCEDLMQNWSGLHPSCVNRALRRCG
jgi:hypothetical protein